MRRVPGTTLTNQATGKVIYTPPVGESLLRDKLANWERFIHDHTEVDPLIRMAVAHYQLLAVTQKSAWEQWVLYVLKGVNETASKYLKDLAQIGVLEEVKAGPGKAFHSSQVRAIAHR